MILHFYRTKLSSLHSSDGAAFAQTLLPLCKQEKNETVMEEAEGCRSEATKARQWK